MLLLVELLNFSPTRKEIKEVIIYLFAYEDGTDRVFRNADI